MISYFQSTPNRARCSVKCCEKSGGQCSVLYVSSLGRSSVLINFVSEGKDGVGIRGLLEGGCCFSLLQGKD